MLCIGLLSMSGGSTAAGPAPSFRGFRLDFAQHVGMRRHTRLLLPRESWAMNHLPKLMRPRCSRGLIEQGQEMPHRNQQRRRTIDYNSMCACVCARACVRAQARGRARERGRGGGRV